VERRGKEGELNAKVQQLSEEVGNRDRQVERLQQEVEKILVQSTKAVANERDNSKRAR